VLCYRGFSFFPKTGYGYDALPATTRPRTFFYGKGPSIPWFAIRHHNNVDTLDTVASTPACHSVRAEPVGLSRTQAVKDR
jgi:hypothetical protein